MGSHSESLSTMCEDSVLSSSAKDLLPGTPCSSSQTDGSSSKTMLGRAHTQNRQVTIDMLPDEILVEIFKFSIWASLGAQWYRLVHVCRRWKDIIFGSSRYLELKVDYCGRRPITEMPKDWQTLPIAIRHSEISPALRNGNIISALNSKHRRRICQIKFYRFSWLPWETLIAAMQKPFPELTDLHLSSSTDNEVLNLPYSFLGGSVPHLQTLYLDYIHYFPVRRLHLSTNNLVHLSLRNIMNPGCISPEDMATCVSGLPRLETLTLQFCSRSPRLPRLLGQHLPLPTPSVLPALTRLDFKGHSFYLERLVARIDAPLLLYLCIFFCDDVFDLPQLGRFISHAEKLCTHGRARMSNGYNFHRLTLSPRPRVVDGPLAFGILYHMLSDPHLSLLSLAKVCKSSFPPICTLEELDITWVWPLQTHRNEIEERMQWLELLALFTSVKNLRLGKVVALPIVYALKDLDRERERAMLPALQSLFIEGFQSSPALQDVVEQFVAARQLSDRFVAVHDWER